MAIEERGFYNWLLHVMVDALKAEAEEAKRSIEFWSHKPIGDAEFDERMKKSDQEMVNLSLDILRGIEAARERLVSVEGKMPRHHLDEAVVAILRGLEQEIRDYRLRMTRIIPGYEEILEKWDSELRLSLLTASDLEQALIKAREAAQCWVEANRLRRLETEESKKEG